MNNLFYKENFEYYLNLIKNDIHFKYSRFNDGELIAIINKTPNQGNCDGHIYFPDMGIELKNALLNYKYDEFYILESFKYWYNTLPYIKSLLDNLKIINTELTFLEIDFIRILHEQNHILFKELLNILKTKNIVIIGADYLSKLDKYFEFKHIKIPIKNCYLSKNDIIKEIINLNNERNNNVYLFSASMATNVIIDVFKNDNKNTYIDWGSVWDTFFVSEEYKFLRKRSTSNKLEIINNYKEYWI